MASPAVFIGTGCKAASHSGIMYLYAGSGKTIFLPVLSYKLTGVFPGLSFAYSNVYAPLVCGSCCHRSLSFTEIFFICHCPFLFIQESCSAALDNTGCCWAFALIVPAHKAYNSMDNILFNGAVLIHEMHCRRINFHLPGCAERNGC